MQAHVEGELKVYFYDTEAGARQIEATVIPARASPHVRTPGPLCVHAPDASAPTPEPNQLCRAMLSPGARIRNSQVQLALASHIQAHSAGECAVRQATLATALPAGV